MSGQETVAGAGSEDTNAGTAGVDTVAGAAPVDTVAGAAASEPQSESAPAVPAAADPAIKDAPKTKAEEKKPEAKVEEKKTAAPTPPAAKEEAPAATAVEFLARKYKIADVSKIPRSVITVVEKMDAYLTRMGPGVMNGPTEGGAAQRDIYYTYIQGLSAADSEVGMVLETILWYFNANRKDVFSPRMAMRFISDIRLGKEDVEAFAMLTHLFMTTCDPTARSKGLERIDMERAIAALPDLRHRERLVSFYIHK